MARRYALGNTLDGAIRPLDRAPEAAQDGSDHTPDHKASMPEGAPSGLPAAASKGPSLIAGRTAMPESPLRKLAAILAADIVGYLFLENEPASPRFFEEVKLFLGR
jgi:hypothetical protein